MAQVRLDLLQERGPRKEGALMIVLDKRCAGRSVRTRHHSRAHIPSNCDNVTRPTFQLSYLPPATQHPKARKLIILLKWT